MASERINVDIATSYDDKDAKKALADAEKIEDAKPELEIGADADEATKAIEGVSDDAQALDDLSPEVTVTADDKASADIKNVRDEAEELSRADTEIVLRAKIDAAKAELASLQAELRATGDRADETNRQLDRVTRDSGPGLRGNAIADLTGPLGEASGAASDFAGVFDGLGDISESVAEKVGVSAATMSSAITGIGVGVASAAALWTLYRQRQEAARQKQEQLNKGQREFNQLIREGDYTAAAKKLTENYEDAYDAARKAGIPIRDLTAYITGQANEIPALTQRTEELAAARDNFASSGKTVDELNKEELALRDLSDSLNGARQDYDDTNGSINEQNSELHQVEGALRGAKRETEQFATAQDRADAAVDRLREGLDALRGPLDIEQAALDFQSAFESAMNTSGETVAQTEQDVLNLKQTVVDVGEALGKSPLQIQTELDKIEAGDYYAVKNTVQEWFRLNPVIIASKLDRPALTTGGLTGTGPGSGPRSIVAPPPVVTPLTAVPQQIVNVTMPRGSRGVDVLRQISGQARRSGRRYGVSVVHYAQRWDPPGGGHGGPR